MTFPTEITVQKIAIIGIVIVIKMRNYLLLKQYNRKNSKGPKTDPCETPYSKTTLLTLIDN